jgi:hypothetical protein
MNCLICRGKVKAIQCLKPEIISINRFSPTKFLERLQTLETVELTFGKFEQSGNSRANFWKVLNFPKVP